MISEEKRIKSLVGKLMQEIHTSTQGGKRIVCIRVTPQILRCIAKNSEFLGFAKIVDIFQNSGVRMKYGNLYLEFYDRPQEEGLPPFEIVFFPPSPDSAS